MKGEMAGAAVTIANPETSAARYHGRAAGTRCQSAVLRSPYTKRWNARSSSRRSACVLSARRTRGCVEALLTLSTLTFEDDEI